MKSKASINGHPIHAMLTPFPIAFFTATLISDIISVANNSVFFWQMGECLNFAGIILTLITAIPGFIDYLFTVPPNSSAKKRAATHGLLNTSVLVLFTVAVILKQYTTLFSLIICFESAGFILMCIAAYMGGTMVYRNQIGIYNRYADKGIWREAYLKSTNNKTEVAIAGELKVNQMKLVHINDKRIVIGKTENGYVAFDDRCTHKGASLAGGAMICSTVQCPWHGSQFDLVSGQVKAGPATTKLNTYTLTEINEKIYLLL